MTEIERLRAEARRLNRLANRHCGTAAADAIRDTAADVERLLTEAETRARHALCLSWREA